MLAIFILDTTNLALGVVQQVFGAQVGSTVQPLTCQKPRKELHPWRSTIAPNKLCEFTLIGPQSLHGEPVDWPSTQGIPLTSQRRESSVSAFIQLQP